MITSLTPANVYVLTGKSSPGWSDEGHYKNLTPDIPWTFAGLRTYHNFRLNILGYLIRLFQIYTNGVDLYVQMISSAKMIVSVPQIFNSSLLT